MISTGETAPGQPFPHGYAVRVADDVLWRWSAGGYRYLDGASFPPVVTWHVTYDELVAAVGTVTVAQDDAGQLVGTDRRGGRWCYRVPGFYSGKNGSACFPSLDDLVEAHGEARPLDPLPSSSRRPVSPARGGYPSVDDAVELWNLGREALDTDPARAAAAFAGAVAALDLADLA